MAELPQAWTTGLTQGQTREERPKANVTKAEVREWLDARPDGDMCQHLREAAHRHVEWFYANGSDGSHDHMIGAVLGLLRDTARVGHVGVKHALGLVERAFLAEVRERRGIADAEKEWRDSVEGAVAIVKAEGEAAGSEVTCDSSTDDLVAKLRAELLTYQQLCSLPDPEYLIKGFLDKESLGQLFGKSGHYKSFMAIDIACHIALGWKWCGRRTRQGPVVYVAAEGFGGIKKRIRAWAQYHGLLDVPGVIVFPRPVNVFGQEWAAFTLLLKEINPALLILDTQARVTGGADENAAKDMGEMIDALDDLKRACGTTVVAVHHEGLADGRGRGSSAVHAALDQQFRVVRSADPDYVELHNPKQKDIAESDIMLFRKEIVELGHDSDGDVIDSVVLVYDPEAVVETADQARKRDREYAKEMQAVGKELDTAKAIAAKVRAGKRVNQSKLYAEFKGNKEAHGKARNLAIEKGWIIEIDEGVGKPKWYEPGPETP